MLSLQGKNVKPRFEQKEMARNKGQDRLPSRSTCLNLGHSETAYLRHDDRLQDEIGRFFINFKEHLQC